MLVQDVYAFLDEIAPFSDAMDFDNSGLLVGSPSAPVNKILVTLDSTLPAIQAARQEGADLIVSHHPVIFDPLKQLPAGSVVYELIRSGISVISAHTNLDLAQSGVNDALARQLGLNGAQTLSPIRCTAPDKTQTVKSLGQIGCLPAPLPPKDFAGLVQKRLGGNVRFVCGNRPVSQVAVCGGSGADCLADALAAGADALVTSEVKHHIFLLAAQQGITLVDAGHFHTEDVVIEPLCRLLRQRFAQTPVVPYHLDVIQTL